jgi:hypothetical protein
MPKYYILTADTSRSPSYDGVSTRVQLIGPFDYIEYVQTFISDSSMPLAAGYRIVELEDATIPVVDPRSISEENKITGRYGEKGVCDQPVPDADIPVAAPRPTWSIVSPGVLQFGNTKFRITFNADTQTFVASRDGKPFPLTPGDTSLASLKLAVEQCANNLREVGIDP